MLLAILAEIRAISIDNCSGVIQDAGLLLLVHRQHHDQIQLLGQLLKPLGSRSRDALGVLIELRVLDLAKIRAVKKLLEADHLRPLLGGLAGVVLMGRGHGFLIAGPIGLDKGGSHDGHFVPPRWPVLLPGVPETKFVCDFGP